YLKSGWIAGLRPETVKAGSQAGFDTASGVAATDQWNFRVQVVRFQGRVYRFIFAARIDSELFARAASETLRSFRAATSNDLKQIRSLSVETVTAGAVDSADSLARKRGHVPNGANLFYVLNDPYPGDPATPGASYTPAVAPQRR